MQFHLQLLEADEHAPKPNELVGHFSLDGVKSHMLTDEDLKEFRPLVDKLKERASVKSEENPT